MNKTNKRILSIFTISFVALTVIICIAFILSAHAGTADPASCSKAAVLGLCFPIGLIFVIITLIICLVCRMWKTAVIPGATILICISPILTFSPLNVFSNGAKASDDNSFTLLTYNVMSFVDMETSEQNKQRTINYILDSDADVVCLQEGAYIPLEKYKLIKDIYPRLIEKYPYHTTSARDLVILSKYPYSITSSQITTPQTRCATAYGLTIKGRPITIVNVHLESIGLTSSDKELYSNITDLSEISEPKSTMHNVRRSLISKLSAAFRNRASQAKQVRQFIDSISGPVILCGDFNDTPSSFSYRTIRGNDMKDAYAECAFGPTITYNANKFYFRIDQVLYRGNLEATSIRRGDIPSSDHYPFLVSFKWD